MSSFVDLLFVFVVVIRTEAVVDNMALNPQYDDIGKGFVQQYYTLFDDPALRPKIVNLYNVSPDPLSRLFSHPIIYPVFNYLPT